MGEVYKARERLDLGDGLRDRRRGVRGFIALGIGSLVQEGLNLFPRLLKVARSKGSPEEFAVNAALRPQRAFAVLQVGPRARPQACGGGIR
jgi:hypothetical protein